MRLDQVIRICCLDDFLAELPNSFETVVGERGLTLSGGQKARVAIARAMLSDPDILILDEASAMLERELEETLWQNIRQARINRTTIILSHHDENIPKGYVTLNLHDREISYETFEPTHG